MPTAVIEPFHDALDLVVDIIFIKPVGKKATMRPIARITFLATGLDLQLTIFTVDTFMLPLLDRPTNASNVYRTLLAWMQFACRGDESYSCMVFQPPFRETRHYCCML